MNFDLGDTYRTDDKISIERLIALDYYWNIVMGGVKRTILGLVAIASKFGCISSDPKDRKF